MDKQDLVLIAVPNTGWLRVELTAKLIQYAGQKHVIAFPGIYKPVDYARNKIVEIFLDGPYTHLLMIDSDTIPEGDAVSKLLEADKDIVSGITNAMIKNPESGQFVPVAMALKKHEDGTHRQHLGEGVEEVDRVGGSCLMIKRAAAEKIRKEGGPLFANMYNPETGFLSLSEDSYFCELAKASGFKIHAHYDVLCQHVKEVGI